MDTQFDKLVHHIFGAGLLFAACMTSAMAQNQSEATPTVFPANFRGEECDTVVASLKSNASKKDEFESTVEYEKRAQTTLASISASGRSLAEPKFFVNSENVSAVYDADRGSMKVYGSLRLSTNVSDAVRYASTVIVTTRSAQTSKYQGQNQFGASAEVKKYRDEVCGVAFLNLSPVTNHEWMGAIEFPLSADIARRSKGNIVIVYLAHLAPPLLVNYRQYVAPTMSAPSEILVTGDALTAVLERFFVVDKRTGDVLYERPYTPR